MGETAVLASIFPANLPYFKDFLLSIDRQTVQNFNLIIANDGAGELPELNGRKNCTVLPVKLSPIQIRLELMKYAVESGYRKLIFADTDDQLSANRVEVKIRTLDQTPIVCNDLSMMTTLGSITQSNYWGGRLKNYSHITPKFLIDKNVVGFGNVALTVDAARLAMQKPIEPVLAPDWFLFYQLAQELVITFTSDCATQYRQHDNNLVGIKTVDAERLMYVLKAKLNQYTALEKTGFQLTEKLDTIKKIYAEFKSNPVKLEEAVINLKTLNINYFWWEETNFLNGSD